MKTKLKFILALLMLAEIVIPAVADNVDDLIQYQGMPAYCLIIDAASPVVDPGDEFDIKFYISGAGDVDLGQISVTVPPEIVKDDRTLFSYVYSMTDKGRVEHDNETKNARFQSRLASICYKRYFFNDSKLPILIGEASYKGRPPFLINFTIADNAPAGDHTITIIHFYKYLGKWYSDKNELEIHVNAWYEKGNLGYSHLSVQSIAIALTVLTILSTFISQLVSKVINIRAARRKRD